MANYVLDYSGSQINTKLGNATTTSSGVMSAEDKIKLNGIEDEANKTLIDDTLTEEGQAADAKATGNAILDLSLITTEERTATGSVVTLENCPDKIPLKSCVVNIEPVQDLHGYDNPWPGGVMGNLLDESTIELGAINTDTGVDEPSNTVSRSGFMQVNSGATLYKNSNGAIRILWYDSNKGFLNSQVINTSSGSVTLPDNAAYFRVQGLTTVFESPIVISYTANPTYYPYSNICPISGWTGCNLAVNKKNFCPPLTAEIKNNQTLTQNVDGTVTLNGTFNKTSNNVIGSVHFILPAGTYTLSGNISGGNNYILSAMFDGSNHFDYGSGNTFTLIEAKQVSVRIYIKYSESLPAAENIVFKPMIRFALDTDATFVPYSGTILPISWEYSAGTVYGGTLDVISGKLSRTQEILTLDGSKNWAAHQSLSNWFSYYLPFECQQTITENSFKANWLKPYYGSAANIPIGSFMYANDSYGNSRLIVRTDVADNVNDLRTYLSQNNLTVTFTRISLPSDIDIDPVTVSTLHGQNNIWADCGDISIADGGYLTRVIEHIDNLEEAFGFYYDKDV